MYHVYKTLLDALYQSKPWYDLGMLGHTFQQQPMAAYYVHDKKFHRSNTLLKRFDGWNIEKVITRYCWLVCALSASSTDTRHILTFEHVQYEVFGLIQLHRGRDSTKTFWY